MGPSPRSRQQIESNGRSPTERRPYSRHGLNRLKARVKLKGFAKIDRRSAGARDMLNWRADLITALGGEETLSPQKLKLVDLVARDAGYIDHLDGWIHAHGRVVNERNRSVLPVVMQRFDIADSFTRRLVRLGLERVPKLVPDLKAYLEQRYASQAPMTPAENGASVGSPSGPDRGTGPADPEMVPRVTPAQDPSPEQPQAGAAEPSPPKEETWSV